MAELDPLDTVELPLGAFDFLDPGEGHVLIPLLEKGLFLSWIVLLLDILVQLLQEPLLDPFGRLLFPELLLLMDLVLYYLIELSLIVSLLELPKANQVSPAVGDLHSALGAF